MDLPRAAQFKELAGEWFSARHPYETYTARQSIVERRHWKDASVTVTSYSMYADQRGRLRWGVTGNYCLKMDGKNVALWQGPSSSWVWLRRKPGASGPATMLEIAGARAYWWERNGSFMPKTASKFSKTWTYAILVPPLD